MRVLGLHVKAGVLNYGLLDGSSGDQDSLSPVDEAPCRLSVGLLRPLRSPWALWQ